MATREDFARVFSILNIDSRGYLDSAPFSTFGNDLPNATANCRTGVVRITCPMVELCSNDDEIAGLLGHELGHIQMQHHIDRHLKDYYTREAEANIYAHILMNSLGYDTERAFQLYIKLREYPGLAEALAEENLTVEEVRNNLIYGRSLRDENITKNVIAKCSFGQRIASNEMWYAVNQRG